MSLVWGAWVIMYARRFLIMLRVILTCRMLLLVMIVVLLVLLELRAVRILRLMRI